MGIAGEVKNDFYLSINQAGRNLYLSANSYLYLTLCTLLSLN